MFELLDMDFSKLPNELQEKIIKAKDAVRRERKAFEQHRLWTDESVLAKRNLESAQADLNECLGRWNPDTNKIKSKDDGLPF